jgi:hypothetical protein
MVQWTVTNGSKDGYKWFGGLTGKVWRVNKNGLEGKYGWEEALMQMAEMFIMISIVG